MDAASRCGTLPREFNLGFGAMHAVNQIIESPITALVIAILVGALALSGRFSVTATQIMLLGAWAVAVFGLRAQPIPILVGLGAVFGGCLVLLAYHFRPEAVPSYSGVLTPKATLLFSAPNHGQKPKIRIGTSNVFVSDGFFLNSLNDALFKVEAVDNRMQVSARITDENGRLVAEIIRNEWSVAPPPATWDRNYNDDTLEVKDAQGSVVLQVHAGVDHIQLQGAWWVDMGPPNGVVRIYVMKDPIDGHGQMIFHPKNSTVNPPIIPPIFKYPSALHLGELAK